MGLIPLKVDPSKFDYKVDDEETDGDTVVFYLETRCMQPDGNDDANYTENVLSSQLVWLPQGNQEERFPGENLEPKPSQIYSDSVLCLSITL